jgi:hypothetical protein
VTDDRAQAPRPPVPALYAVGAVLLLDLALAAVFVQVRLVDGGRSPSSPMALDLLAYYHLNMRHAFAWLGDGVLPLWNPHQSCGAPFAATIHQGFVYPLYLPYLLLDAAAAFEVHLMLHLALACLGVTLVCRHFGLGWAASAVAGVVYGYQGGMMIKVYFPDFLASAAWIPWTVLTVDRALDDPSPRRAAQLAVVVALSLLGGHGLQFHYFTAWALVPFLALRALQITRRAGGRALIAGGVALVGGAGLGALMAAVRLVPLAELLLESWRPPGQFSMDVLGATAITPDGFAQSLFSPEPPIIPRAPFSPIDGWRQAYAGVVPLALALLGLAAWRQRGLAVALAAAGVAAALYAFGTAGFLYPLVFHTPGGNWFRGVDRALIVFGFAVAVLGGAGLDVLLGAGASKESTAPPRRGAIGWAAAMVALVLALGMWLGQPEGRLRLAVYLLAGAVLLGGIVWTARGRPLLLGLLVVLIAADLFHAQRFAGALPSALGGYYDRYGDFFAAIAQRQRYDRTYVWSNFGWGEPLFFHSDIAKAGLVHGVYLPTDYEPLVSQRLADYLNALGTPVPLPIGPIGYLRFEPSADNIGLLDLLGVRFLLMDDAEEARLRRDYPPLLERAQRILQRAGVSLYEYAEAMPRAFIAPEVTVVPADQTLHRMRGADLRRQAFVEDAGFPGLQRGSEAAAGEAEIVRYEPNRVEVDTETTAPGLLVLTDQYYPGWQAWLDGTRVPIYRTDYLFRGVLVPPGRHRVEFTYRPLSWLLGAAASALGLAIFVVLFFIPPRTRTRTHPRTRTRTRAGDVPCTSMCTSTST